MTGQAQAKALPLYVRVGDYLRAQIEKDYRPGDLLPSQQELARLTGTSLITVKRALEELGRAGLIEAVRGRGTVVKRPVVADAHEGVSSLTDNMAGLGLELKTAWTRLSEGVPSRGTKGLLDLKAREKTVRVERLRTVEGEPFCLLENELPARLVPDLVKIGLTAESIYQVLEDRYQLTPAWAEEEVRSRGASREERSLLGSDTRIILEVRRITYMADERPLEVAVLRAPAHRYRYRAQLRNPV